VSGRRAAPGGFDADRRSGASGAAPAPGSRRAARLAEQAGALVEPVVEPPVETTEAPSRRPRRRRRLQAGLVLLSLQLASIAYLSSVGGLLWWSHAPMLVGWQPKVVLTGSMLPVIRPGDVALVGPANPRDQLLLPPGRIVLVEDRGRESGTYLHRVVRYEDNGFLVTKGDANPTEDHPSVDPARVRGQVRMLVPAIGRPVVWVHDHRYTTLGVSLGLTWAAMAFTLAARGRTEGDAEEDVELEVTAAAAPPSVVPSVVPHVVPAAVPAPRSPEGPTLLPAGRPLPSRILSHRTLGGPAPDTPDAVPATPEAARPAGAVESAQPVTTGPDPALPGRFAQALDRPSVEEVLTVMAARPPSGDVVMPDVVMPDVAGPDAVLPQLGLAEPAQAPVGPTPPAADAPPPVVLSAEAERLVLDLDAFESTFGAAFGADDDEDVSGFDGRGFDL
jgi:signal peptidase